MRKLCLAVGIVTVLLLAPFMAKAQTATSTIKIAYIDLQRVMFESDKGKEAKKTLQDEADKLKATLGQKQDELQKLKDELDRQTATITADARAEKERQYQNKLKDYQRLANDYQTELQQKDMQFSQRILKELQALVTKIGESEKYTVILEKSQPVVLFAAPTIDITDKVIKAYNDSSPKKPAAPAAAAPKK